MTTNPLDELRNKLASLLERADDLSTRDEITPEDDAELNTVVDEATAVRAEIVKLEERKAKLDVIRAMTTDRADGAPQIMRKVDPTAVDYRTATRGEMRDAALKTLETDGKDLAPRQADHVDLLLRTRNGDTDGTEIAKRILITEKPAYRSAFMKGAMEAQPAWTPEEAAALNEFRAASLTSASGGYGVPVLIDPTIILTSAAADAPVLSVARVVTITTNIWKGVSSAGVSWSYDAEASAVSDDAPTLAQPSVTTYMGRGWIPFSIEIGDDYPGFAAEMRALLDAGYVDLVAYQSVVGSGSSSPRGIFTALDANTNVEVVVTTDGAFGLVDVHKAWKALPERYRGKATWLMHTDVDNEIDTFSTSGRGSAFRQDLLSGGASPIKGRPVILSDYCPEFTGTTGASNILVVGDFSNYVIAQRAGMSIELVPHLFDVTNNRPTGQRGWFAHARHGMDSVADRAFVLLQNQ